jgi:hypothetical protein
MIKRIYIKENSESDSNQRKEALKIFNDIYEYLNRYFNESSNLIDISEILIKNKIGGYSLPYAEVNSYNKEYEKLAFQFNPQGSSHFGIGSLNGFKVIVLPILIDEYNPKYLNTRFSGKKFEIIHEIIHFLDTLRFKNNIKVTSAKKYDQGDKRGYYNTPEEFNAYYQELTSQIESIMSHEFTRNSYLKDFNTFFDFIKIISGEDFINFLDINYIKKLKNRLYKFYEELKEKYND